MPTYPKDKRFNPANILIKNTAICHHPNALLPNTLLPKALLPSTLLATSPVADPVVSRALPICSLNSSPAIGSSLHRSSVANNRVKILGHRGARGEVLENSIAGFIHACQLQQQGLAGIEFDVQLTQDGHLLVFHDQTLERLSKQQTRINQLTLNQSRRVKLHEPANLTTRTFKPHPLISLDELFCWQQLPLHRFSRIELEVKTHERTNYGQLIKALENSLTGHRMPPTHLANLSSKTAIPQQLPITLTSFDCSLLAGLQRSTKLKHFSRGLLVDAKAALPNLSHRARQLGCNGVGIYHKLIDEDVVKQCQRANLPITAWTVNSITEAKRLMAMGITIIITDYPSVFLRDLRHINQ